MIVKITVLGSGLKDIKLELPKVIGVHFKGQSDRLIGCAYMHMNGKHLIADVHIASPEVKKYENRLTFRVTGTMEMGDSKIVPLAVDRMDVDLEFTDVEIVEILKNIK